MWKDIMYCSNEKEYMMRLHMFEQSCVDTKVFVDYVKETWLTPHKERFVEAWTNKVMHLGNTTTNRVESAHWKLKLMLENSMGDLCKCWEAMNNMIRLQHKRIRASFQKSFYDEEHEHRNPFYQRLNTFVSTEAQRRIAEEYDKVEWVGTDKSICGCSLRRTYGLPCACELGQYKLMGEPIPLDSVHIQWRKLSMECELTQDTEDGSELDMSTEMNALWKRFRSLDVIGKRVLKSKVRELAFPSTSSICPPPEKVKTKGRVKKSKGMKPDGYDVYRDPSYFEHVNATYGEDIGSQPSQSKKRQASQSKKHPSQSSHSSKNLLLTQFPDIIQPYIDDIFDVAADGNCGFRAIALLLGFGEECWSLVRKRLDQEIVSHVTPYDRLFTGRIKEVRDSLMISGLGVQPMDKWLSERSSVPENFKQVFPDCILCTGKLIFDIRDAVVNWAKEIGKRALKSKVRELAFLSTSSMCPPPKKVKTKGRVKKSKGKKSNEYDVYRDPYYFEHVNATYCEDLGSQSS
ncbi:uncharacterized protein [Cicer arietinum]|uniref:uncharacterized protein n=1 Tax=Cicer arietinum TaxID=3827 RepID=UPI003CC5479F